MVFEALSVNEITEKEVKKKLDRGQILGIFDL